MYFKVFIRNRLHLLKKLIIALFVFGGMASGSELIAGEPRADTRPNIIFIMADDLAYMEVGCYGNSDIPTPNMDRLAEEGMRFTDAHAPAAVCTPTRYSVLTGRYCWRSWMQNYVLMEHMPLLIDTERMTVGSMLKAHGYSTGCVGKWHLGWGTRNHPDWSRDVRPGPLEVGFDYYFGVPFSHNASESIPGYLEDRTVNGKPTQMQSDRKLTETAMDISKKAVTFIAEHHEKPFFLYYPTTGIHLPTTPNERFKGKSKAGARGDYVVEFDWAVGEIMQALEKHGIADNTLLIVTSDNGGWAYPQSQWRGFKGTIYEGGHRVPFIARWPGRINPGTVNDEPICLVDLMATCAAIVGQKLPDSAGEDSYDISPALLGEFYEAPLREAIVHHSASGVFAIRQGKWKLIDGPGDGMTPRSPIIHESGEKKPEFDPVTGKPIPFLYDWAAPEVPKGSPAVQLYDLEADSRENVNLYEKEPEVVKRLSALLEKYKTTGRSR